MTAKFELSSCLNAWLGIGKSLARILFQPVHEGQIESVNGIHYFSPAPEYHKSAASLAAEDSEAL